ncbi:hypothetical protein CPT03_16550 [Pedobacter ginsengisoli]|uniref:CoF synthetase n=1 Tax=Pedobacter ginsengisoli TaxID=363852 RepID=A0A2D1U8Q6_9SPHI|nr:hypothetical protein [Pedobacter ginsengisoli]ATP57956.1 hypothetical protein CPT03_16550 [Pedobacter ginsengisoli]
MSIAVFLKENLRCIPPSIGMLVNKIPYSLRPGLATIYKKRAVEIKKFERLSAREKQTFILNRIKDLTEFSYSNTKFYKNYYDSKGFHPSKLKLFDDIQKIPLTSKSILNEYDIEDRSSYVSDKYIVNTGGSSGTPFSFYIQPSSMGHEWAHMHHVWGKLNYKVSDFKLMFGGRSDLRKAIEYDVVRNHFAVDIYAEYKLVADQLKRILKKHTISYLHGYPSSIYDFAIYCKNENNELGALLKKGLRGVFLGSEYPHEHYRAIIEEIFNVKTISWYGHTERAILAYEKEERFKYEPFGTYGFSEALNSEENDYRLIATSYYNFASPLIRYDTGDRISEIETDEGILNSFKITKGREGEFILDNNGKMINLTGLIFGRHHEIFNYSKFIQVKQISVGKIEIHFVSDSIEVDEASKFFDERNLNLEITYVKRDQPYRTSSGKTALLIK